MQQQFDFARLRATMFSVLVGMVLLIWASRVSAQNAPNDYQIGLPPHGDFSGSDFDSIQLNNGNLHIEIPLWSTAGRGPSVAFKYVYDSLGWGFNETCNRISGICTDRVTPTPAKAGVVANHLRFTLVSSLDYGFKAQKQTATCPGNVQVYTYSYSMAEPSGTHHHFLPDPVEAGSEVGYCFPHPNTLYADDGSGYMVLLNQSTGATQVVKKDGSKVTNLEDTNGNEVIGGNPGTDTLGRYFNIDGSYYDSNGIQRAIAVTTQTVAIQTHLCWSSSADYCNEYTNSGWGVTHSITLPNGQNYTFTYDQGSPTHPYYGQPLSVTLPTGGQVTWSWSGEIDSGPHLVSRQLSGEPPWTYGNFVITDPAGNDMAYTCGLYYPPGSVGGSSPLCYIITRKYYQGSSTSGTLLKTVQTDYQTGASVTAILPIHETTTWNQQNLVSRTETDYDSYAAWSYNGTTHYTSAGNPIQKREYGYGVGSWGALARTTVYSYLHLSNSTYLGLNIVDRKTLEKVYQGSSGGTLVAQTQNTYDGVGIAGNTSGSPAPNHDYTNFPASYNFRGNLTQVSRGLKGSTGTWTWLNTNYTYNDLGEVLSSTDPLNHPTYYDYTDSWASISNPQCVTSSHSYAFPTTITDALGHRTKHTYFSCTSLLGSTQDENDIAASRPGTTYSYDLMDRLTAENSPDGGQTQISYNDSTPYSKTVSQLIQAPSLKKVTTTVFDGLGRVQQTQLADPDCGGGSGLVKVDHAYGYTSGLGKFVQVSTPYCNNPDSTYGLLTTTSSDALDRVKSVVETDGSTVSTSYSGTSNGLTSTVTDEAGKKRTSQTDALGRLTAVWEDPSGLNYETDYGYDTLDNLVSVTQKGGAASGNWRTRTFNYNSLSWLKCAADPEITSSLSTPASCPATDTFTYTAGTIEYTYDADGNLSTRTAPAPDQTSTASTVVTDYSYDAVNRLIQKSYTGTPATPTVKYGYDGVAPSGCATTPPSLSDANPVSYRTSMCDGSGATSWSHDEVGRTKTEQRTINGSVAVNKAVNYTYYKDGETNTITYPGSGRVITYAANSAGRPASAKDTANGINYVVSAKYAPQGALASYTDGSSIFGAFSYNPRMQPLQMFYGTNTPPALTGTTCPGTVGNIMHRIYNFAPGTDNGNVQAITNCRDTNRSQNLFYDNFNRITQAYTSGSNWGETFTIDPWGNLTNRGPVTGKTNYEGLNAAPASIRNQLNGYCHDAAGNLVLNSGCPGGSFNPTYNYDIENRLIGTAGYSYIYDGDGNRVAKCAGSPCTTGSTGTLYWRGDGDDALAESGWNGTFNEEYIFFGGKRVARRDVSTNAVHYYFADHLGSASVITSSTGSIQKEADYYPYGGEIVITGSDINNYKFTGKERDSESGNDYFGARYYSSSMGRWMSPDPLPWIGWQNPAEDASEEAKEEAHEKFENWISNPQNFNMYAYVNNNPLNHTDPTGMAGCKAGDKTFTTCTITITYDPKTSKGTLVVTGQNKGDKEATTLLTTSVVVGGDGHVTPTGTFTAKSWEKDHVSTKYGTWADTPYSKTKLGLNAFGPYQLHIKELDSRGIYIHGTMGPSWNPWTGLNSLVSPTSHGCVRMCNRDDEALHNLMPNPSGNKIIIQTTPEQ